MKKTLLKTTMVAAFTMLMGTASAQLTYFAKAGLNLNNLVISDADGKDPGWFKTGYGMQIGGGVYYELNDNMGIEAGLGYSQRGASTDLSESIAGIGTMKITGSMLLHYIDIPLSFKYGIEVGDGKLNIGIGPKLGLGLSGNWKTTATTDFMGQTQTTESDQKMYFGSDDTSNFKFIDLSLGTSVSYEISNFEFGASYHYGLTNHENNPTNQESTKQSMLTIFLAYRFND